MTYRSGLRRLEAAATPAPWKAEGEYYGALQGGEFRPLGFSPHHPSDSQLIAVYRNHLSLLLDTLDSLQSALQQAGESPLDAAGLMVLMAAPDDAGGEHGALSAYVAELDKTTTQPPWDPAHLAMGMDILQQLGIVAWLAPTDGDAQLIAAVRSAVPRAFAVLQAAVAILISADTRPESETVAGLLRLLEEFDQYRVDEGVGTGTV